MGLQLSPKTERTTELDMLSLPTDKMSVPNIPSSDFLLATTVDQTFFFGSLTRGRVALAKRMWIQWLVT